MGKLGKFVGLSSDERSLLVRAALLLMGVRLGLALLPFRSVERATWRLMARAAGANDDRVSRERLAWAVRVAGRYVPGVRCLAQAIVLKALLKRHGYPARIRIGFAKEGGGEVEGHAWVESRR